MKVKLNLKPNDMVEIKENDDKIIISKLKNKNITLKERIKQYKGSNLAKDFIWDENVGKEIW